jgi:dTDP-6-deoxy-L-talose 4-dehydrogenase (NAD+)
VAFDLVKYDDSINYFEYFFRPDLIIHLAWEGLPNYRSSFHMEENLPRHYAFLKNIITNGCKDVTVTGTCFEYGMRLGKLSEDLIAHPDNPYAIAKNTLNKYLEDLRKADPFEYKWIRLFYMYGKGQHPAALFSQLDKAISDGDSEFNMSGGEQVRDFLPVESVASYIVRIATQQKVSGIINCCSGIPVKVKDLVLDYLKIKKKDIRLNLGYYKYPDYEAMEFWGDNNKLQKIINGE